MGSKAKGPPFREAALERRLVFVTERADQSNPARADQPERFSLEFVGAELSTGQLAEQFQHSDPPGCFWIPNLLCFSPHCDPLSESKISIFHAFG